MLAVRLQLEVYPVPCLKLAFSTVFVNLLAHPILDQVEVELEEEQLLVTVSKSNVDVVNYSGA